MVYKGHSKSGAALTELFHVSFPFHGALMAAGERLTHDVGLTAARWQVLSTIARSDRPEPVANVARIMGLVRQSVQRSADELEKDGLITFGPNPHHKRAPLMHLTQTGRIAFDEITSKQVPWVNAIAKDFDADAIVAAVGLLKALREKFQQQVGERPIAKGRRVFDGSRRQSP